MSDCNCPPLHDVFRHPTYTKDPCPVHPEPEGLADMLIPNPDADLYAHTYERDPE